MSSMPASNSSSNIDPKTTVGELRKQYGAHFAAGYGDQDTLGELLGRAGAATLEEYIEQSKYR